MQAQLWDSNSQTQTHGEITLRETPGGGSRAGTAGQRNMQHGGSGSGTGTWKIHIETEALRTSGQSFASHRGLGLEAPWSTVLSATAARDALGQTAHELHVAPCCVHGAWANPNQTRAIGSGSKPFTVQPKAIHPFARSSIFLQVKKCIQFRVDTFTGLTRGPELDGPATPPAVGDTAVTSKTGLTSPSNFNVVPVVFSSDGNHGPSSLKEKVPGF